MAREASASLSTLPSGAWGSEEMNSPAKFTRSGAWGRCLPNASRRLPVPRPGSIALDADGAPRDRGNRPGGKPAPGLLIAAEVSIDPGRVVGNRAGSGGDRSLAPLHTVFAIFHGAPALIVIYATSAGGVHDCFLAAENILLAAGALGLGTCPIGLAIPCFDRPDVKAELEVPTDYLTALPIVIGVPAGPVARPHHEPPNVLARRHPGVAPS